MTTQQPLAAIAETGRFMLTFFPGDPGRTALDIFHCVSEETFARLWSELLPSLPNESIRRLLLAIKAEEHEHSHVSAALAKTLFERKDRQVILEHVPFWRAEAARLIIEDPEASDGELHAAVQYAPDDMKARAADLLYEFIARELPEAGTLYRYRLKGYYADILVVSCNHQEDAIRQFLTIPWDVQDEIDGKPVRIRVKDSAAKAILCRGTDAVVLERIADHVLSEPQPFDLLLAVAEYVPSRSKRAMEQIASWCDQELPPRLATRPQRGSVTHEWSFNQWRSGPDWQVISHTARSLNDAAGRVALIAEQCHAIMERHGLAPYGRLL